jgi:hypothetical protein
MQEPSTPAQKERISPSENSNSAYVYMVLPFQVVKREAGDLFDPGINGILNQEELQEVVEKLTKKLNSISYNTGNNSIALGDFTKYYDFMKGYFGRPEQGCELDVFKLNTSQIFATADFEQYSNLQAQFAKGAYLGKSDIQMKKLDEVRVMVNSAAGIGFFIFGFECYSFGGEIAYKLADCEFFRNVGWRRNQKLGPAQLQKHQWRFEGEKAHKGVDFASNLELLFFGSLRTGEARFGPQRLHPLLSGSASRSVYDFLYQHRQPIQRCFERSGLRNYSCSRSECYAL